MMRGLEDRFCNVFGCLGGVSNSLPTDLQGCPKKMKRFFVIDFMNNLLE